MTVSPQFGWASVPMIAGIASVYAAPLRIPRQSEASPPCDIDLDAIACDVSGDSTTCFPCGGRISWCQQAGCGGIGPMTLQAAKAFVTEEHPVACSCRSPAQLRSTTQSPFSPSVVGTSPGQAPPISCDDVLDLDALGYTCRARINWCAGGNCGRPMSWNEAAAFVAADPALVDICGPCGFSTTISPTAHPTDQASSTPPPAASISCDDVLDLDALGYTCRARINWCAGGNCGRPMSWDEAAVFVAAEPALVDICGPCAVSTTMSPTTHPTIQASSSPTLPPTLQPTFQPSSSPTAVPTLYPTSPPSASPTLYPTSPPSASPTSFPTERPSVAPTTSPLSSPTVSFSTAPVPTPTTSAPTATLSCSDVLDILACHGSDCFSCGSRIAYCASSGGRCGSPMNRSEAENFVGAQFPVACGPCRSPPPAATLCPAGALRDGGLLNLSINDRAIFVHGQVLHIKGVCWNPIPRGGGGRPTQQNLLDYAASDGAMMAAAGINVVRSYYLLDTAVMDVFWRHGIMIVNPIWPLLTSSEIQAEVRSLMNHPALLMYSLGNEWNYNNHYRYSASSFEASLANVDVASQVIRAVDPYHPIATVYGELPSIATVQQLPCIDVWGLNVYRFDTFGPLFTDWTVRSTKPMFLAEFGADAFNALPNVNSEDVVSQAAATVRLVSTLNDYSIHFAGVGTPNAIDSGGCIFEWADEHWKFPLGSVWIQEPGDGVGVPGSGPYPDNVFNEEWWGLVTIDRAVRPAYSEYARLPNASVWPHHNGGGA